MYEVLKNGHGSSNHQSHLNIVPTVSTVIEWRCAKSQETLSYFHIKKAIVQSLHELSTKRPQYQQDTVLAWI